MSWFLYGLGWMFGRYDRCWRKVDAAGRRGYERGAGR